MLAFVYMTLEQSTLFVGELIHANSFAYVNKKGLFFVKYRCITCLLTLKG